jgi:hypothetical protein
VGYYVEVVHYVELHGVHGLQEKVSSFGLAALLDDPVCCLLPALCLDQGFGGNRLGVLKEGGQVCSIGEKGSNFLLGNILHLSLLVAEYYLVGLPGILD